MQAEYQYLHDHSLHVRGLSHHGTIYWDNNNRTDRSPSQQLDAGTTSTNCSHMYTDVWLLLTYLAPWYGRVSNRLPGITCFWEWVVICGVDPPGQSQNKRNIHALFCRPCVLHHFVGVMCSTDDDAEYVIHTNLHVIYHIYWSKYSTRVNVSESRLDTSTSTRSC